MKADLKSTAQAIEASLTDNPALGSNSLPPSLRASRGNTISMAFYVGGTLGEYCVRVTNPNSSKDSGYMFYLARNGGLQPFTGITPATSECSEDYGPPGPAAGQWTNPPLVG